MTLSGKYSKIWPFVAIVLLFGISILLRLPSFSIDPIKNGVWTQYERWTNTEVWTHDKYVIDVYESHPVHAHKFASYIPSSGDEFLPNKDDSSLTIYTSFPPTHFVALYATLKAIGAQFTFLSMQLFSLMIHLVCVLLLYYLCLLLTRDKFVSVVAASVYIFSTGTLWNHMNVYWAHQLLMPVFLLALITFVKRRGVPKWWESLGLGFAMSVITWTGAVAAAGFAMYGGFKFFTTKNRAYLSYLYMILGVVVALGLILLQVLITTGASVPEYLAKVLHRAQARSAGSSSMSLPIMAWRFINDLILDYGGYMLIAYTLTLKRKLQGFEREVLFVASFPLLESFVLLEHDSVYGFGRLKWLVPVVLLIAICGGKYAKTPRKKAIFVVAATLAAILHAVIYFVIYGA